jgi:hypothetical protein
VKRSIYTVAWCVQHIVCRDSRAAHFFLSKCHPPYSYTATIHKTECDMRFVFCATAISYMLNDWAGVDKSRASQFIQECRVRKAKKAVFPTPANWTRFLPTLRLNPCTKNASHVSDSKSACDHELTNLHVLSVVLLLLSHSRMMEGSHLTLG